MKSLARPGGTGLWEEAQRHSLRLARRYALPGQAEDVAQEALLRAWRRRASLRDPQQFLSWLATIVRNEAWRRRASPVRVESLDESAVAVESHARVGEEFETVLRRVEVSRALRRLDEHEQLLLRLRYADDLTQSAIAQQLGISEGTIKVQLHRARGKLKEALLRDGYEEANQG